MTAATSIRGACLALLSVLAGCMTAASQFSYATGVNPDRMFAPSAVVYGGTRVHVGALGDGVVDGDMWRREPLAQAVTSVFVLIDLPLCVVADTVLLPITLLERAFAGPARDDA